MKPSLVIVGLGNPGAAYERTRHNLGFQALDLLKESFGEGEWEPKQKLLGDICEARVVTVPVLLLKPSTFMNNSGNAIRKIVDFYKLDPAEQLLVLCDEVDLPSGDLRLRKSGGPGTHNGLKSIVEQIGEGFPRLRLGIGKQPSGADLANWVLSVPSKEERAALDAMLKNVPDLVKEYVLDEASDSE